MRIATTFVLISSASQETCDSPNPPCSGDETCCEDPAGWECCVNQATYCVAPRGGFATSTCCPHWTVGCTVGSVGCCDPATPWQLVGQSANATEGKRKHMLGVKEFADFEHAPAADAQVAYALFVAGTFTQALTALTIDVNTGVVSARKTIAGPAKQYMDKLYGGSTRLFAWEPVSSKFVFVDSDRTAKGPDFPLQLFTIDPVTGESTSVDVSGAKGYPSGIAYDEAAKALVIGVQTSTTAEFYAVDLKTGAATSMGSVARGADESSKSFYAAYISHAHNGQAVRVGHAAVTAGQDPGVSTTTLGESASTKWADPALAANHGLPVTVHTHPAGGFVSLAPLSGAGKLDVVSWDSSTGKADIVAALNNSNVPQAYQTGPLGYVGAHVQGSTFSSLSVSLGTAPYGLGDKWAVATVDLSTKKVVQSTLNPQPSALGANAASLSGFGIPAATEVVV
eukprot:CAMPEP_0204274372 /NCGR_PEP_ID=MMETSP0468-20130131/25140_1 /ASSEMBLY_ACC=CAM_ASM_000383 /TAXON_ID=2969 /ORGANISM="Oxyrrhis marina" /LENGTH=452 /DNA_ID=CAMNT_0051250571 /DNA_START=59 /DNA_END=1417 /DNA_ORIENTATION=+